MSTEHPPADFMFQPRVFVRIYRLPEKLSDGFCFGGGKPISFLNVDWFETSISDGPGALIEFVKRKRYYDRDARFLVLGDHPDFTFTIDREVVVHDLRSDHGK